MKFDLKTILSFFFCSICTLVSAQQAKKVLTIEDILNLKTVSEVQISPDGKWLAYTVSEMDLKKDKSHTRVYSISMNHGEPIAITGKDYSASQPRWSPYNKYLSFLASRQVDEKTQVWISNRIGGAAEVLTKIPQG